MQAKSFDSLGGYSSNTWWKAEQSPLGKNFLAKMQELDISHMIILLCQLCLFLNSKGVTLCE